MLCWAFGYYFADDPNNDVTWNPKIWGVSDPTSPRYDPTFYDEDPNAGREYLIHGLMVKRRSADNTLDCSPCADGEGCPIFVPGSTYDLLKPLEQRPVGNYPNGDRKRGGRYKLFKTPDASAANGLEDFYGEQCAN